MTPEQRRATALTQLNLVLAFFQRVESRLALVFGVDVSMLALLTAALPPYAMWDARMLLTAFAVFLIVASVNSIWWGMFPNVAGGKLEDGKTSVVFFRSVGDRKEAAFVDEFSAQTEESYTRDLLGQIWINSKILSAKFASLERAFLWMLAALVPWLAALAVMLSMNPNDRRLLP